MGKKEKDDFKPLLLEKKATKVSYWLLGPAFFVFVFALACFEVTCLDIGVHIRTGSMVLETGYIPNTNIYSYTKTESVYIDHEWLFQTFCAFLLHNFGENSLNLMRIGFVLACFVFLVLVGGRGAHPAVLFFFGSCALIASSLRFYVRPELVSLLGVALFIFLLDRYRRTNVLWHRLAFIGIMLAYQVIWVNSHGFFIFGPLFVLFFLVAEIILIYVPVMGKDDPHRLKPQDLPILAGAVVLLFLVNFINPYGVDGALYPVSALGKLTDIFHKKISELKSPFLVYAHVTFKGILYFKILLFVGVPLLIFSFRWFSFWTRAGMAFATFCLIFGLSELGMSSVFAENTGDDKLLSMLIVFSPVILAYFIKVHPFHLLMFSAFGFMAYRYNRNIGFFALVCLAILPPIASRFFSEARAALENWRRDLKQILSYTALAGTAAVLIFIVYCTQAVATSEFYYSERSTKRTGFGFSKLAYPTKAVEFVITNGIHLLPGNMYNNFDTGNYLTWKIYPYKRVFIDGRTEVYGEFYEYTYYKLMADSDPQVEGGPEEQLRNTLWYKMMKEYNVNFVLYKHSSNDIGHLPRRLHSSGRLMVQQPDGRSAPDIVNFKMVYYDETAAVYLRDIPQNRELIKKYEIRFDKPLAPPEADPTEVAFFHNFVGRFLINIGQSGLGEQEFRAAIASRNLEDFHNGLGATLYMNSPALQQLNGLKSQYSEYDRIYKKIVNDSNVPVSKKKELNEYMQTLIAKYPKLQEEAWKQVSRKGGAIDEMQIAVDMNPNYFEAHNNLHRIYREFGNLDKALYHLEMFYKLNRGLEVEEQKQVAEGVDMLKKQQGMPYITRPQQQFNRASDWGVGGTRE